MAFEITSGSIPAMDSDSKPADRLTIFEDLESDMFDTMAIDHGAATPSARYTLQDADDTSVYVTRTQNAYSSLNSLNRLILGNSTNGETYLGSSSYATPYCHSARYVYDWIKIKTTDRNGDPIVLIALMPQNKANAFHIVYGTFSGVNSDGEKRKCFLCDGYSGLAYGSTVDNINDSKYSNVLLCSRAVTSDLTVGSQSVMYHQFQSRMPITQFSPLVSLNTYVNQQIFHIHASPDVTPNTYGWVMINSERYYKLGTILIKE